MSCLLKTENLWSAQVHLCWRLLWNYNYIRKNTHLIMQLSQDAHIRIRFVCALTHIDTVHYIQYFCAQVYINSQGILQIFFLPTRMNIRNFIPKCMYKKRYKHFYFVALFTEFLQTIQGLHYTHFIIISTYQELWVLTVATLINTWNLT